MKSKFFDTDAGRVLHYSLDGVRFYPAWMIREYCDKHDICEDEALAIVQGDENESY